MKNLTENNTTLQTPIEILLQVGPDGKVSSRNVYEFLGLSKSAYARWCSRNITENHFAIGDEDYEGSTIMLNGNECSDFRLTVSFAKKLCMLSKTERGEQARDYFILVENKLKEVATTIAQMPLTAKERGAGETASLLKVVIPELRRNNTPQHIIVKYIHKTLSGYNHPVLPIEEFVQPPPSYEQLTLVHDSEVDAVMV